MDRIKEFMNKKQFIFYIIGFVSVYYLINLILMFTESKVFYIDLSISIILCLVCLFSLIFNKNTNPSILLIFFYILTLGSTILYQKDYYFAFIPAAFIPIGIVLHHILYRTKIVISKLFPGLLVYGIALAIGGIASKSVDDFVANYMWYYTILILLVVALGFYSLLVLASDNEAKFIDFARFLTYLGLLFTGFVFLYLIGLSIKNGAFEIDKQMHMVGWLYSNAVAICMLATIPGAIYLIYKEENKLLYTILGYVIILGVALTLSRGGIAVLVVFALPTYIVFSTLFSDKKKKLLIYHSIFVGAAILLFGLLLLIKKDLWNTLYEVLTRINWSTGNNRAWVYESVFKIWGENKAFGIGIVGSFNWYVEAGEGNYQFAHNTLLQMLLLSGLVGAILMVIHLVDKYARLFIHPTKEKLIVCFSFLLPAIYGLIDVTYLSPLYMLLFLASYTMFNEIFSSEDPRWYIYK